MTVSDWCFSKCVTCCMSESCPLTNPSLTRSSLPSNSWFFPSVRRSAFDLFQHVSLSCLGAQSSQKTGSLGSYFIPLCKAGCTHDNCSILLLLEFTSEIVNSPSPGWGPAGLGGLPQWSVSDQVQAVGSWVVKEDWVGGGVCVGPQFCLGSLMINELKCPWK